jgi:hypothetical protein
MDTPRNIILTTSVVDRHHIDARPDLTFHFVLVQIQIRIRILPQVFQRLENRNLEKDTYTVV